jgi:hypothetical protein
VSPEATLAAAAVVCAVSFVALVTIKVNPRWLRRLGWVADDRAWLDDQPVEVLSPEERRQRLRLVLGDTGPIVAGDHR